MQWTSLGNHSWATMQAPESPKQCQHRGYCSKKKYDHITPILKYLYWLAIRKWNKFKILPLMLKCMHGCALLHLKKLLVKQANTLTPKSNTENYTDHRLII